MTEKIWQSDLQKCLSRWDVVLRPEQMTQFTVYLEELQDWNQKINLTALREPEHIVLGHFVDSLAPMILEEVFEAKRARAVDIGSGAGFPGLPIKIVKPNWQMTLVESVNKKCDFLRAVVEAMEITHVDISSKRCEELGRDLDHRETYDFVFARALSNLSTLIEYGLPLLRIGGTLVAHRGRTAADETSRVNVALQELGAVVVKVDHYEIPQMGGSRALVCIQKVKPTSRHYPRRIGVAAKRPL